MTAISRRGMLRGASALGMLSSVGILGGLGSAHASSTTGYKALVCVHTDGGLDPFDTLLPYDLESYEQLAQARQSLYSEYKTGSGTSSRDRETMLALNSDVSGGRRFAFPQDMPELHSLYERGNLAVLSNVGTLVTPMDRSGMESRSAELPPQLFSHNDQQSLWMTGGLEGEQHGWGGLFADCVAPVSGLGRTFTSVVATRPSPFLVGRQTRQYPGTRSGPVSLRLLSDPSRLGLNSDRARAILDRHYGSEGQTDDNVFIRDMIEANNSSHTTNKTFIDAIGSAQTFATRFPDTGIGRQLETIAATISVRGSLGVGRQVFFARQGGYDTHAHQARDLPGLQRQLSQAIGAFSAAMEQMGIDPDVTLFTISDFGRTAFVNGTGTDHGWGGHQFVVGGGVNGGRIVGDVPDLDFGSQRYTASQGRMIPTTSVDQYAGALGSWFGLNETDINDVLPNLQNFSGLPDLF